MEDYFENNYLDTREFLRYVNRICKILIAAKEALSIRQIHIALGDNARPEWTMDALARGNNIVGHGVMITRYSIGQTLTATDTKPVAEMAERRKTADWISGGKR